MTLTLPRIHAIPVVVGRHPGLSYRCRVCDTLDSDGTRSPAPIDGGEPHWLCHPCSVRVWTEHLRVVHHRELLIWASRVLGWPARTEHVPMALELAARREAARQVVMAFGGGE